MKAMLLAAGLGTRLKPFTDHHPKALAMVNGKSLLLRNIEYLRSFGVNELIVNVHHFAKQITDHLIEHHDAGIKIFISDESDEVLETGGGLKKASWFFNDANPFVLMNADILTDMNLTSMLDYHQRFKPLATLAISKRVSSRFFFFNQSMQLCGWGNQLNGEDRYSRREDELQPYAFSGGYLSFDQTGSEILHGGCISRTR
jgi:NDP-sugar pyrophosphorylase family protein